MTKGALRVIPLAVSASLCAVESCSGKELIGAVYGAAAMICATVLLSRVGRS